MIVHRRPRRGTGIPTSPIADVAFLLLAFFLATTVFDEEKGLPIVLPVPGEPVAVPPANLLQLTVRPDGVVEVRRGASPRVQEARADDIAALWRAEGATNPHLVAAVLTHPDAPYRLMVDVLDALQTAGATRVSLQQARADR